MALTEKLTAIADAIRSMTGKTDGLTLDQMPTEILDINPLNFTVVGGTTQPPVASENTIWINTDTPVSGWSFSSISNPTWSMEEGYVYILSRTADANASIWFNALKKTATKNNEIILEPISAKQYISGAWVNVEAKSYQNGAWVEWAIYLYNSGDEYKQLTGGWETSKNCNGSVTKGIDNITVDLNGVNNSNTYGHIYTSQKVDLSGVSKLRINSDWVKNTYNGGQTNVANPIFGVSTSVPNSRSAMESAVARISSGGELDVSNLSGLHYVFVGATFGGNQVYSVDIVLSQLEVVEE